MAAKPALQVVPASPPEERPIGLLVDELEALREKRRVLKAAFDVKEEPLKTSFDELEKLIIARMLKDHSEGSRGRKASANLSRTMLYSVADRAALEAWTKKTGNFQVFTNHLSSASITELLTLTPRLRTTGIPGTKSFEKIGLKLSSVG